jgi:hypothetical protein
MKRRTLVGIVILAVAIYIGLVIGLRLLLAADTTGNWIAAVAGATGVATAVLTGLLVGVTWSYVRLTSAYVQLTSRMVELEATAPAREAEQRAIREFLNVFAVAETFAGSMRYDAEYILSLVTIEGTTSTKLADAQALLDKKISDSFDMVNRLYAAGHQLSPSLNIMVLGAVKDLLHANQQLHWLAQAIRAEVTSTTKADRQITREAIKARYNSAIRPTVEPPEAREEWEAIAGVSGAAVTQEALRRARDQATAALLNLPPTHQN